MRPILICHGHTEANIMQALDTTSPGSPLDEVGLEQADGLPDRLGKAGPLHGLGSLRVSPILRTRQTIAPIEAAADLSVTIDSGLREMLAADLEMSTNACSVACRVDTARTWMAGRLTTRVPGSPEDGHDTLQHFDEAVGRICEQAARAGGSAASLVSYGTVPRLWTSLRAAAGGGADPLWVAGHPLRNTGITVTEGGPGEGWYLLDWNDGA